MSKKKKKKSDKGGPYEREICKELSVWWSSGRRNDIFWRTAGSGSRATIRDRQGLRTADSYGDIMATHESGKPLTKNFVISLKRGYTGEKGKKNIRHICILDLIDLNYGKKKGKPVLMEWWEELREDMRKGGRKHGMIIFRRDHRESVIAIEHEVFCRIREVKPCSYPLYHSGISLKVPPLDLQIISLKEFFYWCDPQLLGAGRALKRRKNFCSPFAWIKPGPNRSERPDGYRFAVLQQYAQAIDQNRKNEHRHRTLKRRSLR